MIARMTGTEKRTKRRSLKNYIIEKKMGKDKPPPIEGAPISTEKTREPKAVPRGCKANEK